MISYFHGNFASKSMKKFTASLEKPEIVYTINRIQEFIETGSALPFFILLGISKLHPDDQYCKKTGRTFSFLNIKKVQAELTDVSSTSTGTYFSLKTETGYKIKMQYVPSKKKIFLKYVQRIN